MGTSDYIASRNAGLRGLGRHLLNYPEIGVGVAIVAFFLMYTLLDRSMASEAGIVLLFTQVVYLGIAAFGMSHLMLAGEIDLSTGAMAGLAAAVAAVVIADYGQSEAVALLVVLVVAIGAGLLNSLIVLWIGVPSFFGTLGTHFILLGIAQSLLRGRYVSIEGSVPFLSILLSPSPIFGLPWSFVVFVVAVLSGDFLVRRSKIGAVLAATGGNRQAANAAGINTTRVKTLCFILVSICAAIGGLLVMKAGTAADEGIGDGWQLWVVAIAVIGGSSFSGGLGSILGGFLGAILIQVIKLGLGAAQIKTNAQGIVIGTILIVSAILDVARRKIKQY